MKRIAIIYWSGTGNTELMAQSVSEGAQVEGAKVELLTVDEADESVIKEADAIALGCPSMGAEELEDGEFSPFYERIKHLLSGKKVALFGSYDWGTGEWMENWQADVEATGAILVDDGLIVHLTPEDQDLTNCNLLGQRLAN